MDVKSPLLVLLAIVLAGLVGAALYFFAVYTNETIIEGAGYGFAIGESKEEVLRAAEALHRQGVVTEMLAKHDGKFAQRDFMTPSFEHFDQVSGSDEWVFFYTTPRAFHNSVRLRFEDGSVIAIWRY